MNVNVRIERVVLAAASSAQDLRALRTAVASAVFGYAVRAARGSGAQPAALRQASARVATEVAQQCAAAGNPDVGRRR